MVDTGTDFHMVGLQMNSRKWEKV